MKYSKILANIHHFVSEYVDSHHNPGCCFHNFHHIQTVLKGVVEIGAFYRVNEEESFVLKAAAYFHDLSYISHGPADHEEISARMAKSFLEEEGLDQSLVRLVENCIKATKYKQRSTSKLEAIFCDADLCHLGGTAFEHLNIRMLQEIKNLRGIDFDEDLWLAISLHVLQNHRFHTDYGMMTLDKGKQENIQILEEKLRICRSKSRMH
ncbi:HD domain-containing protein [Sphingobacterium griseoflavum]|uniref:HD domain-containing protein n=1 Tax=Sphingobacterium griseoflavum TaxID=1474952 RepID=A0ABQ3I1I4_9SPHI|nr:HD domain-containing protein [Sphingobacterium griseoflavum]GHE45451.1 hypothetical protein GCM10017764_30820 [Sphingobacterium griseoflavum]